MAKKTNTWSDDVAREIARIDGGGDAWADTEEVTDVEVKRPLDKVIPVRLTSDKWTALRLEAAELGVGPTTLARMWILEKLRSVSAAKPKVPGKPAPRKRRSA